MERFKLVRIVELYRRESEALAVEQAQILEGSRVVELEMALQRRQAFGSATPVNCRDISVTVSMSS